MIKRTIPAVLLPAAMVFCVLTAGGCRDAAERTTEYRHSGSALVLTYPERWQVTEQQNGFSAVTFTDRRNKAAVNLFLFGGRDFDMLAPVFGLEVLSGKIRETVPAWSLLESGKAVYGGISGQRFAAQADAGKQTGFFTVTNRYAVALYAPADNAASAKMLETALQGLSFAHKPSPRIKPGQQDIAAAFANPAEMLDYGRELLQTRGVNVENYHLAREQFRAVLRATKDDDPLPDDYVAAWRLLEITKTVQNEAFQEARLRTARHIGLKERHAAMAAAAFMIDLIADRDDPRYQEARRLYNRAAQH